MNVIYSLVVVSFILVLAAIGAEVDGLRSLIGVIVP